MLSIEEAQQRILERATPLRGERVPVVEAAGRVLAENVVALRPLPPFDNSAMDGYAVRAADVGPGPGARLRVVGESRAGAGDLPSVGPGQAVRVFTGARMPPGADTVVIQEVVVRDGAEIVIERPPRPKANVRYAGEDLALTAVALQRGMVVDPGAVGLACALGRTALEVIARPRVAILATGDELREPDEPVAPGEIVSSNSYALVAQVAEAGGVPVALGIARDEESSIRQRLEPGLKCDVILTIGGVSVGDYDLVRDVLDHLGWSSSFWKVNIKPGKPLSVGWLQGIPVIGLPGNPASSMVTFELFVRPLIRRLQNFPSPFRPEFRAPLDADYEKNDDRVHVVRCRTARDGDRVVLAPLRKQGSGMLTSMVGVDALALIDGPARLVSAPEAVRALALC
jgi:molybdopterin molybdotransferase